MARKAAKKKAAGTRKRAASAKKSAGSRKRGAAAKKTVARRKQRVTARKAGAGRKKSAARTRTVATSKRVAARKKIATRKRNAAKGIPIIFYTTGLHPDYHANTDEVSKIQFEKLARIVQLVYATGARVANLDHAPVRDNKGPRRGKAKAATTAGGRP